MKNVIANYVNAISERHTLQQQDALLPERQLEHFYLQSILAASQSACTIYDCHLGKLVYVSDAFAVWIKISPEAHMAAWPDHMPSFMKEEDMQDLERAFQEGYVPFIEGFDPHNTLRVLNVLHRFLLPSFDGAPRWLLQQNIPFTWQGSSLKLVLQYFTDVTELPVAHCNRVFWTELPNENQVSVALSAGQTAQHFKLNEQEYGVLKLLARGFERKEIADALHTSTANIDRLRTDLLAKTDTPTTAALIDFGVQHGLVY